MSPAVSPGGRFRSFSASPDLVWPSPASAMESLELLSWVLEGSYRVRVPQRVGPTFPNLSGEW